MNSSSLTPTPAPAPASDRGSAEPARAGAGARPSVTRSPRIDIVIPVYNEQAGLERSVRRLHAWLRAELPFAWQIVIADNASTDATPGIAHALAFELERVSYLRLEQKGRGRALRRAWSGSQADVLAYMDVDLSTDLRALLPLLAGPLSGNSALAIGSRLAPGARVRRGGRREFISRVYNRLLRTVLRARFADAQCGFKAIRADAARELLPLIEDEGWFFDTELLILAQRRGMRIQEVPVTWTDDPDSRVEIVRTALDDLRGVGRLRLATPWVRFALVGAASTLAYAGLYLALRGTLGSGAANALALALTAVANTQANRRWTFGLRGREGMVRQHLAGALVYLLALGLTDGALDLLSAVRPGSGRLLEVLVLVVASGFATVTRFIALRSWVFGRARRAAAQAAGALAPSS